jgi:rRNA maturation endonuclease Nob1
MSEETTVYEYTCDECGTGYARKVKEKPTEPCDTCGSTDWVFSYTR